MSREIKFRVWNLKDKTWERNFTFLGTDGYLYQECYSGIDPAYNMNDFVIQRYTGLTDKNGKEIYDGDILKTEDETLLVEYCDEYAKFGAIIYLQDGREPENSVWLWGEDLFHDYSELAGNMFENPELLES